MDNLCRKMWEVTTKLEKLDSNGRYNVETFINALNFQISQLSFFYDSLVPKQGNDPSKTYYNLKSRPKEHQLIYVNLTRGFPKELYDAHYCYVLKDCGTKFVIIPTTSIKKDSPECSEYEKDIEIIDSNDCRLNVDDIRVIDFMRIVEYKGIYNVKTERKGILSFVNNFFSDMVDKEDSNA